MKAYSRLGRLVALGFAGLTLTFLYFFRSKVAYLYGNDAEFIRLTSHFLSFALMFQLADAFTAPIQGFYVVTRIRLFHLYLVWLPIGP